MANDEIRVKLKPFQPMSISGKVFAPMDVAETLQNFQATPDGTLMGIIGPLPYVPDYGSGYPSYGTMHGICHAALAEGRDVLLIHTGNGLWVHQGWNRTWEKLLDSSGAQFTVSLTDDSKPRAPTQFEIVSNGIIIMPQEGTPYFYDGEVILPLGYATTPSAPDLLGPQSVMDTAAGTYVDSNTLGHAVDSFTMATVAPWAGFGRIGTVEPAPGSAETAGHLLAGAWQGAVQFIDRWGNLSPISSRSNPVLVRQEDSGNDGASPPLLYPLESIQKQFAWVNIPIGPSGTIGRILWRTRDIKNSGTEQLFRVPTNLGGGTLGAYATIPDNHCKLFPDNIPDAALVSPPLNPVPVTPFRYGVAAMGRFWAANFDDAPGLLRPSLPGKWGTFLDQDGFYPDPAGAGLTGLCRVPGGLLAFTARATYFIAPNDDGLSFKSSSISTAVGCIAPSSIATLPNGAVVWLAENGFFMFDGEKIVPISMDLMSLDLLGRINKGRAIQAAAVVDMVANEYRCYVPLDASQINNHCFVFDGTGWKTRTNERMAAVCRTQDHRSYILGAGSVTDSGGTARNGVWVLDREVPTFTPESRSKVLETKWLTAEQSDIRKTLLTVKLWLRETSSTGTITMEVYRDYRKTVIETITFPLVSPEDSPPVWGTTLLGTTSKWVKRRPYWTKKDVYIASCEVFKLRFTTTSDIEIVAINLDMGSRPGSAHMPRGS